MPSSWHGYDGYAAGDRKQNFIAGRPARDRSKNKAQRAARKKGRR